ncbi:unnamed protein product [Ixodes persulcatus]
MLAGFLNVRMYKRSGLFVNCKVKINLPKIRVGSWKEASPITISPQSSRGRS